MGASIFGFDLGFDLPTFSSMGAGFWITLVAIIVLFLILLGVGIWFYIQHRIFYIQIRDFENISGQGFQLVKKNTARLLKVGDGGEELLLLRKGKTFRTAYGKKMGKNEYWFCKGQDGYWYNVVLGDLDAKMGMLDIEPIDRDMRYMHVAIRKNIQDRYKKKEGIEKYVPIIISGLFLIIMIVAVWLLISKVGDMITVAAQAIDAGKPVAEAMQNVASKIDTICSGSGIRSAT
jgi:uncharacterized membrane protein